MHCLLCDGWVHVPCGQVLVSEEVGLQKDGTCAQLESDMVVCQNCDSPMSSDDQVSDGAHKLCFPLRLARLMLRSSMRRSIIRVKLNYTINVCNFF
jgi:hypothetical protein